MMLRQSACRLATLLATGVTLGVALTAAAAAGTPRSAPPDNVHCVLAGGHLYLGSAGAVRSANGLVGSPSKSSTYQPESVCIT